MDLSVSSEVRKKYFIIVVLVAVVLAMVGIFLFYYFKKSPTEEKMPSWAKDLKGIIHLTLADEKSGDTRPSGGLYILDLGAIKRQATLNLKDGRVNITEHISPDGLLGVYASFPSALDKKNGQMVPQLFTRHLINGERKQITTSQTLVKRNPEWSLDGQRIAFMAQVTVGTSTVKGTEKDLKKWSVFVTDLAGKEQLVSNGVYPQWLPDSQRLIILRKDGLYLCFLANSQCERALDLSAYTTAFLDTKIDLSRDGKMIVYSNLKVGDLILIKILSQEPFQLGVVRVIKTGVFWPVFSEDSQYLIAEEVDFKPSDEMSPRLVAYKLDTMEKAVLLSLDDFWQEKIFITDWRY